MFPFVALFHFLPLSPYLSFCCFISFFVLSPYLICLNTPPQDEWSDRSVDLEPLEQLIAMLKYWGLTIVTLKFNSSLAILADSP